jgi:phosphate transport system protein
MSTFHKKLAQLKDDLITQGDRVVELTLRAVESFFEVDLAKAQAVIDEDSVIDRVDVEIERASIPLLGMGESDEHAIRSVLTVDIAEQVVQHGALPEPVPRTFQVMANSVIGMVQDANRALSQDDTALAERVLRYDDTVDEFKSSIVMDAQEKVASGEFGAAFAFRILTVAKALERIADHCTNICEQVIYLESGLIVRHLPEGWTKPAAPDT